MTVLVTGASGFLGSRVMEALAADTSGELHGVARTAPRGLPGIWHEADLLDSSARVTLMARVRPTHLVHLAWTTEHGAFWDDPVNEDWVEATTDLLARFTAVGGRRAVFAGSCAEYDWTGGGAPDGGFHETRSPVAPATAYGAAKAETWRHIRTAASHLGVGVAWARLFFLFGPGEHEDRLVPTLVRTALDGRRVELRDPGRRVDLMSTSAAAAALVALLRSDVTGPVNIGSGREVGLETLAETIERLVSGGSGPRAHGASTTGDRIVADVTRLSTEVGFTSKEELETALARTIDWWRRQVDDEHEERPGMHEEHTTT